VDDFAIYGRFYGRSHRDEGSTDRILFQLAAGLFPRRRGWMRRDTGHLRKSADDEHNYVAQENSADKNDHQPKYVSQHGSMARESELLFLALLGWRIRVLIFGGDLTADHGEHSL
jgi:hypothetical protein